MRTLLIAPSFLAVFSVAIFSLGWLVIQGLDAAAINGSNPPPWAFTGWAHNYPSRPAIIAHGNSAIHDQIDELSLH